MQKKTAILISILMVLIILTACSVKEQEDKAKEYEEYANDYIALNYPSDWHIQTNVSHNNQTIFFEKEANFQFVVQAEAAAEGVANEDEIKEEIEKDLYEGYRKMAEEIISIKVIEDQEITIDGEKARELKVETKLLDSTIEQLYYILNAELSSYNEVKNYLKEYQEVEIFIDEMKYNPEKLEDLEAILLQFEVENQEEKQAIMIANAFIGNAIHFIKEEKDAIIKQDIIIAYKENIRLNIFFQSNKNEYQESIGTIQKIIDSITFLH
ncbi:hypothetical protein CACET_c13810 [Clostridium aceticum]|uniref:Uncharacterized protein n=1 Tax=Clostridium aceticum TaxID=84022 RepID=A0A0D8IBV2_9CLOT|nr:hypothetical protein [Clostridium aceticum]AKL94846.1 hypothetical protein CACET_c13810 [Clostridium aceticum]KJF27780.1 hypothetical protein TZ02_04030 [Clostridium aceticum]